MRRILSGKSRRGSRWWWKTGFGAQHQIDRFWIMPDTGFSFDADLK
jgi:hypothetical protein